MVITFLDVNNVMCLVATMGLRDFPVIISERTDPNSRPLSKSWTYARKLTYPWADALVTQTRCAMGFFPRSLQSKGAIIPNPVVLPYLRNQPRPQIHRREKMVISMGSLRHVKGHDLLIAAFSKVSEAHPDWNLVIYGEGDCRPNLLAQIEKLGLQGRVRLPGATLNPQEKLLEAELFVLPSRAEGFPNVLGEAMACGLPVISFNCPSGPSDLIKHDVNGLLVPPEDVDQLACALRRLMGHESERVRLGAAAPEVLERFSIVRIMAQWNTLVNGLRSQCNDRSGSRLKLRR